MSKKYTSTISLFVIFIGFLWWGLTMLTSSLGAPVKDGEAIVYSLLLLACSLAALVAILLLPRGRES